MTKDKSDSSVREAFRFENEILRFVSSGIRDVLNKLDFKQLSFLQEIRLRAGKPLMLQDSAGDWFVDKQGMLMRTCRNPLLVSQEEIFKTLGMVSENSIYAYQDEIRGGFITLRGGHRVGICGKVVTEGGNVKNIKDISGLNLRIAREVTGCASKILGHVLYGKNGVYNTLIVSPPQCGKTTLVRDLARSISDGSEERGFKGRKVGIVDERSEIAACYKGIPQNQVGVRTDVMDGCPKSIGMIMMLRSMSPDVIVTDEIGNTGDRDAVMQVINAGIKIITTAHGYNISELKTRQEVLHLIEAKIFERYIVLNNHQGPGTVVEVIDGHLMKKLEESPNVA